jgi:integrative and conjugative element protein (TIGR02256 family)
VVVPVSAPERLSVDVAGLKIVFEPDAMAAFDKHRQNSRWRREAGGQLFARIRGSRWEIKAATGPKNRDRRGRYMFMPDRSSEQEEIYQFHSRGLEYVGDWHTHPQDEPEPSESDLTSIARIVASSQHHLPGFLLVIVGRREFPSGLWVSFHSVGGPLLPASPRF